MTDPKAAPTSGADEFTDADYLREMASKYAGSPIKVFMEHHARLLSIAKKLHAPPPTVAPPAAADVRDAERLTDEQIVEIRDRHLPNQGDRFDCIAFARDVIAAMTHDKTPAAAEGAAVGWTLVPNVPTQAMLDARARCGLDSSPRDRWGAMLAAAPTMAAPAVEPTLYVTCRECKACGHIGIDDDSETASACGECDWTGPMQKEDRCPGCECSGTMCIACPECDGLYVLLAEARIPVAAPAVEPIAEAVKLIAMARRRLLSHPAVKGNAISAFMFLADKFLDEHGPAPDGEELHRAEPAVEPTASAEAVESETFATWRAIAEEAECVIDPRRGKCLILTEEMCVRLGAAIEGIPSSSGAPTAHPQPDSAPAVERVEAVEQTRQRQWFDDGAGMLEGIAEGLRDYPIADLPQLDSAAIVEPRNATNEWRKAWALGYASGLGRERAAATACSSCGASATRCEICYLANSENAAMAARAEAADADYEWLVDDQWMGSATALEEAMRYAMQYVAEGPVTVRRVERTLIAALAPADTPAQLKGRP